MEKRELPSQEFIEQKITKQVTITAGAVGNVSIDIPREKTVFLKGYGYTWFTLNTYKLNTGNTGFPKRTDQEGSPAIPALFGTPFKARSGGKIQLSITNGDSSSHTYDVVFYIVSNELLDEESTGGDLNLSIGGATGVATQVSIVDATGTTAANVTANGMQVYGELTVGEIRTPVHTAVTVGTSSTLALAANANRESALFVNDSDETIYLSLNGSASLNSGIRLNANGGSYEMSKELGSLAVLAVNAISTSGSKKLLVTEFVEA